MAIDKTKLKHRIGEIAVCVVAAAILLTILIPTVSMCIENGEANKCQRNIYILRDTLEKSLSDKETTEQWKKLLSEKKSTRITDELISVMGEEKAKNISNTEYVYKNSEGKITINCLKHEKLEEAVVELPIGFEAQKEINDTDKFVDHLQIDAFRTYMQGEAINPENPEQMKFTSEDNLKEIFSDIIVSVVFVGGEKKQLAKEQYKLSTAGFDMSVPGTKNLKISYTTDRTWKDTLYADFAFEVMEKTECPPLVISFGDKGLYELAAWDWTDYVTEASQSEGNSKNFDASIVYYKGKHYYYPDGFHIDKRRDNSNPETSAADVDDNTIPAYRIEFKTDVIISSKENEEEMKKADNGALMLEDEQVYIWQTEPSKELESGWIRVYCELKKQ